MNTPMKTLEAIQASAGTGKTFTLCQRVVEEVAGGLHIGEIVLVTFTLSATAELKSRVRERLRDASAGLVARDESRPWSAPDKVLEDWVAKAPPDAQARLQRALIDFDQATISTIHSFCSQLLTSCAFEAGASLADKQGNATAVAQQVAEDLYRTLTTHQSPALVRALVNMKLDLEALRVLARRACELEAAVVPSVVTDPGPLPDLTVYQDAIDKALEHSGGVVDFLAIHDDLHHRKKKNVLQSFPRGGTQKDFDTLCKWLRAANPMEQAPAAADRFTHASIADATVQGRTPPTHDFIDDVEAVLELHPTVQTTFRAWSTTLRRWLVDRVRTAVVEEAQRRDERSFDDLVRLVKDASTRPQLKDAVKARWKLALVDEFQDTNPVQWTIFRELFGGLRLVVVGDPKQSIYAFRRADIHAYQQAVAQAVHVRPLEDNHRSDERLLRAIDAVFAGPQPFAMPGLDFNPPKAVHTANRLGDDRAPLFVVHITRAGSPTKDGSLDSWKLEEPCAERVAEDVARELIDFKARPKECAVLTRTNPEALAVRDALRRRGIPALLRTKSTAFESPVAQEMVRVLDALIEPTDRGLVSRALTTSLMGLSAQDLVDLRANAHAWSQQMLSFRAWGTALREDGVLVALESWATESGVWPRLAGAPLGGRRIADLRHLIELMHQAEAEERMAPSALRHWLDANGPGVDEEQSGQRIESDADAVQVSTVHKAKGLEYDRVWLPFAWKATWLSKEDQAVPRYHDDTTKQWTLDLRLPLPTAQWEAMRRDKLREDLRVLYVAMTRARHRCVMYWGAAGKEAALGYLLHRGTTATTVDGLRDHASGRMRFDPQIKQDLIALDAHGVGAAPWAANDPIPCSRWTDPQALDSDQLTLRVRTRQHLDTWWRRAAYSGLVRQERERRREAEPHGSPAPTSATSLPSGPIPTADVFGGTRMGDLVHDALEHHDFCGSRDDLLERLREVAPRHGLTNAPLDTLADALDGALRTPLFSDGFTLAGLPGNRTLRESEFVLPVHGGYSASTTVVGPKALGACFEEPLASRVAGLGFLPVKGFLGGKLDLIFEHDGRFHLLDWKSNKLGTRWVDYAPDALKHEMEEGHSVYELQANLYALSLHRMLRQRLGQANYDFDQHFGEVIYAFVRGMSPQTGMDCGIWRYRPTKSLLDRLEATLQGGSDD